MTPARPQPRPRALVELLDRLNALNARIAPVSESTDTMITGVTHDSRQVQPGDLYVAIPGFTAHGADFAEAALAAGARAVLTDTAGAQRLSNVAVPIVVVDDPRAALGHAAAWAYGDPADDLLLVGITGTNGKTTTAWLVNEGLRAAGHVTGMIGTLGTFVGDWTIPTVRTTPEACDVHALLGVMRERGVTAVVMEVSSHALTLHRVAGLVFDVAGFTNLSQDHLDFHGSMQEYFAAKASLFTPTRSRRGVVCVDGEWGRQLADQAAVPVSTMAADGQLADWQVLSAAQVSGGRTRVVMRQPDASEVTVDTALPGRFNVANTALAVALLRTAGVPADRATAGIAGTAGVPGRMERVDTHELGIDVFVDYAHSPDAIDRVVVAARETSAGRVVVVIGGGGDRDREKRPLMGAAAAAADLVIVTDDNPRSEDPATIRASVLSGVPADTDCVEEGDRRRAIARALASVGAGDCVLILGKGHETGQEFADRREDFDDRVEAAAAVAAMRTGAR